jgi:K+-transporting ATPase ATPase B chain
MKRPVLQVQPKALLWDTFCKFHPKEQIRNPTMLVVFIGAFICTIATIFDPNSFNVQITIWLWFTSFFANFAESFAEGRGKNQADSLRKTRKDTLAKKLVDKEEVEISAHKLRKGDLVVCEAGDIIPGDGDVVEGVASVDESAITGESAPVIRESGGDRSAVTGGTKVLSDRIVISITANAGESFLDRMITMVEGSKRQPTPNEVALNILLMSLTIVFIVAIASLKGFLSYSEQFSQGGEKTSIITLIALLVCLIPTTIGALLSAIGISGIDRLVRKNVMALSGKAVEAAGDIDVLLLDKTGTITLGNRVASEFRALKDLERLAHCAQLASFADETPEGRSIVILAKEKFGLRGQDIEHKQTTFVPFTAFSRMSGVDIKENNGVRKIRKGAVDAICQYVKEQNGEVPEELIKISQESARLGATPLAVADQNEILGIVVLKDMVKGGIRERFLKLRRMGIKTVMITGDNPLTAASIAAEAGVDDFVAEATPEMKLKRIRDEQAKGHLVGMIGDGTNDAPALAQADVGVAMNTGTQAAREAGNMVDLDSNPTKLIEIVEVGKQLLMTRGALTTFSIANDVAKYFAILPAMFSGLYAVNGHGPLEALNIMGLSSPKSAILSSVIFNALIIVALIPLAIHGVSYRPMPAIALFKNNILIYGLGGLVAPFFGIKAIDMVISFLGI